MQEVSFGARSNKQDNEEEKNNQKETIRMKVVEDLKQSCNGSKTSSRVVMAK